MSLGSNKTAGPPMLVAAESARGSAVTISAGVSTRRQETDTAENNAFPSNAPFAPLVS